MGLFKRRSYITINRIKVDLSEQSELPTVPDGKWIKCSGCGKTVYKEDLGALKVCPNCDGHFRISASERLAITVDRFEELFEDEKPKVDVAFPGYEAKLEKAAKVAKENEAVTVGGYLYNLGLVSLGNMIGGVLFVAVPYIVAAKEKSK